MRTAHDIVTDYRTRGYSDERLRFLALSRPEPLRSEILALLQEETPAPILTEEESVALQAVEEELEAMEGVAAKEEESAIVDVEAVSVPAGEADEAIDIMVDSAGSVTLAHEAEESETGPQSALAPKASPAAILDELESEMLADDTAVFAYDDLEAAAMASQNEAPESTESTEGVAEDDEASSMEASALEVEPTGAMETEPAVDAVVEEEAAAKAVDEVAASLALIQAAYARAGVQAAPMDSAPCDASSAEKDARWNKPLAPLEVESLSVEAYAARDEADPATAETIDLRTQDAAETATKPLDHATAGEEVRIDSDETVWLGGGAASSAVSDSWRVIRGGVMADLEEEESNVIAFDPPYGVEEEEEVEADAPGLQVIAADPAGVDRGKLKGAMAVQEAGEIAMTVEESSYIFFPEDMVEGIQAVRATRDQAFATARSNAETYRVQALGPRNEEFADAIGAVASLVAEELGEEGMIQGSLLDWAPEDEPTRKKADTFRAALGGGIAAQTLAEEETDAADMRRRILDLEEATALQAMEIEAKAMALSEREVAVAKLDAEVAEARKERMRALGELVHAKEVEQVLNEREQELSRQLEQVGLLRGRLEKAETEAATLRTLADTVAEQRRAWELRAIDDDKTRSELEGALASTEARAAAQEAELVNLRSEYASAFEDLIHAQAVESALREREKALHAQTREVVDLRAALAEAEADRERFTALESALAEARQAAELHRIEIDKLTAEQAHDRETIDSQRARIEILRQKETGLIEELEHIDTLETRLAEARAHLAERDEQVAALATELTAKRDELLKQGEEIEHLAALVLAQETAIEELTHSLDQAHLALVDALATVGRRETRLGEVGRLLSAVNGAAQATRGRVAAMAGRLDEAYATIAEQREQLGAWGRMISTRNGVIQSQTREIALLNELLADRDHAVAAAVEEAAAMGRMVSAKQGAIASQTQEIDCLNRLVADLHEEVARREERIRATEDRIDREVAAVAQARKRALAVEANLDEARSELAAAMEAQEAIQREFNILSTETVPALKQDKDDLVELLEESATRETSLQEAADASRRWSSYTTAGAAAMACLVVLLPVLGFLNGQVESAKPDPVWMAQFEQTRKMRMALERENDALRTELASASSELYETRTTHGHRMAEMRNELDKLRTMAAAHSNERGLDEETGDHLAEGASRAERRETVHYNEVTGWEGWHARHGGDQGRGGDSDGALARGAGDGAATGPAPRSREKVVTVRAGDGLAKVLFREVGASTPDLVARVAEYNNLPKDRRGEPFLQVGQTLRIPVDVSTAMVTP